MPQTNRTQKQVNQLLAGIMPRSKSQQRENFKSFLTGHMEPSYSERTSKACAQLRKGDTQSLIEANLTLGRVPLRKRILTAIPPARYLGDKG